MHCLMHTIIGNMVHCLGLRGLSRVFSFTWLWNKSWGFSLKFKCSQVMSKSGCAILFIIRSSSFGILLNQSPLNLWSNNLRNCKSRILWLKTNVGTCMKDIYLRILEHLKHYWTVCRHCLEYSIILPFDWTLPMWLFPPAPSESPVVLLPYTEGGCFKIGWF